MMTAEDLSSSETVSSVGRSLHEPVLTEAVLSAMALSSGGLYVDATVGAGGHASAILSASGPSGKLIGLDRDLRALGLAKSALEGFGDRVTLIHRPFADVQRVIEELGVGPVDGILADLGVSSMQLDEPSRGFSFRQEGPLDMRMDPSQGPTALQVLQASSEEELQALLAEYGEERRARSIARSIVRALSEGTLHTTSDLRKAVVRVTGPRQASRTDPATRVFQALRIAVNDELEQLGAFLERAPNVLRPGGILAVISFHSLEDRMVKWAFRQDARLDPVFRKPVVAEPDERERNPRSRSAKLRVARRADVSSDELASEATGFDAGLSDGAGNDARLAYSPGPSPKRGGRFGRASRPKRRRK